MILDPGHTHRVYVSRRYFYKKIELIIIVLSIQLTNFILIEIHHGNGWEGPNLFPSTPTHRNRNWTSSPHDS